MAIIRKKKAYCVCQDSAGKYQRSDLKFKKYRLMKQELPERKLVVNDAPMWQSPHCGRTAVK
jgi:hypothetical protein